MEVIDISTPDLSVAAARQILAARVLGAGSDLPPMIFLFWPRALLYEPAESMPGIT
jgi:hypothetical protein